MEVEEKVVEEVVVEVVERILVACRLLAATRSNSLLEQVAREVLGRLLQLQENPLQLRSTELLFVPPSVAKVVEQPPFRQVAEVMLEHRMEFQDLMEVPLFQEQEVMEVLVEDLEVVPAEHFLMVFPGSLVILGHNVEPVAVVVDLLL